MVSKAVDVMKIFEGIGFRLLQTQKVDNLQAFTHRLIYSHRSYSQQYSVEIERQDNHNLRNFEVGRVWNIKDLLENTLKIAALKNQRVSGF